MNNLPNLKKKRKKTCWVDDVNSYSLKHPIVADQTQYHEVNIKTLNVVDACERFDRVYSMVFGNKFVAVKNPYWFRLLVMGKKRNGVDVRNTVLIQKLVNNVAKVHSSFSVFASVREYTSEDNDLYRKMIENSVLKLDDTQTGSKCTLVYDQMNEHFSVLTCIGFTSLTVAEDVMSETLATHTLTKFCAVLNGFRTNGFVVGVLALVSLQQGENVMVERSDKEVVEINKRSSKCVWKPDKWDVERFMILIYFFETYLDLRQHVVLKLPTLPKTLEGVISQETFEKSRAYSLDKSHFHFFHESVTILRDSAILFFGILPWFWKKSENFLSLVVLNAENEILHNLTFLADVMIWSQITNLPFSSYPTFVIEGRHGFSKQAIWLFIRNLIKGLCLDIVLGPPIVSAIIVLVEKRGPYLAIYFWAFMFVLSLVMITIYPVLIAPLFNKFTPFPKGVLRFKIKNLASFLSFPLKKVVVDGSTRLSHSNADMYGFFKNKRIVFYDTLSQQRKSDEELIAVSAHELGRWKLDHTMYSFIAVQIVTLLQFTFQDIIRNHQSQIEHVLVKRTLTGISDAREYQMLWLHLAYRDALLEKLEDGAEPLDDDSDLEYELEPLSCSVVASSTLHPGSVKSATHRVEHTASAASSSLKVSIHQCNAFPSNPSVEGPLKEELQAVVEVSDSMSDNLPKQQVQENGANEGVMEHKAAVSIPESESKNLEAVAKYCHGIFTILEILKQQNVLAAARDTPAPKYFGFSSLRTRMS